MKVFYPYSVDYALSLGLRNLVLDGRVTPSRNGPQLRFPTPVTTCWGPRANIVSRSAIRDNNPFFSVIESLWMLAGRNDVQTPAFYAANIENYSDDGLTMNSAYGHRWVNHFGYNQLDVIAEELKKNPTSRRCVLSMWNPYNDLKNQTSKDLSCNTQVYFDAGLDNTLNMTVTNRSNDMVWGAYGANVVHFSFLHQYMASRTGLKLGTYYQVSNNLHVYPEFDISKRFFVFDEDEGFKIATPYLGESEEDQLRPQSRVKGVEQLTHEFLDEELPEFLSTTKSGTTTTFKNTFLEQVAKPMQNSYILYKAGDLEGAIRTVLPDPAKRGIYPWLSVSEEWLTRRLNKRNKGK